MLTIDANWEQFLVKAKMPEKAELIVSNLEKNHEVQVTFKMMSTPKTLWRQKGSIMVENFLQLLGIIRKDIKEENLFVSFIDCSLDNIQSVDLVTLTKGLEVLNATCIYMGMKYPPSRIPALRNIIQKDIVNRHQIETEQLLLKTNELIEKTARYFEASTSQIGTEETIMQERSASSGKAQSLEETYSSDAPEKDDPHFSAFLTMELSPEEIESYWIWRELQKKGKSEIQTESVSSGTWPKEKSKHSHHLYHRLETHSSQSFFSTPKFASFGDAEESNEFNIFSGQ